MAAKIDIINELYIPVLAALDIYPDDTGKFVRKYAGKEFKVHVSGKEVILPTPERLRNLNSETTVPFHPLSESVSRGDSSIQNLLKQLVTFRLTFTTIMVMQTLLEIAANKDLHDKLKSDQLDILSALPEINEKTVTNFSNAMQKIDMETINIIKVYNRRNGDLNGRKHNRVAVVSFPLFSELDKPKESTVWGVREIRKRDIHDYSILVGYVLPNWHEVGAYSAGSDSLEAPSFIALLKAYGNVASRLNDIIGKFKNFFEDDDLIKDLSFLETLSDLSRYRGVIPPLEGNIGSVVAGSENDAGDVRRPKSVAPIDLSNLGNNIGNVPVSNEKVAPQPAQPQQPAYVPQPQPQVQPQYQPQLVQQPMAPVGGQYQPVGWQQPQPPVAPSNNPIDSWNQNTASYPQQQYQPVQPQQAYYQPQYQQQPQPWAGVPQQQGWGNQQPVWGQPQQNQNGYVAQTSPYVNPNIPPAVSAVGLPQQQYQQPMMQQQPVWGNQQPQQQYYQPQQQAFTGFKTR